MVYSSIVMGCMEKELYNHGLGHTQTIADICFEKANGDLIYDTDGKQFIDLNGTLNLPFGHSWDCVKNILENNIPMNAVSYATTARLELCKKLKEIFPKYCSFQFYSAGTEANEGSIRYAIAITGKDGFASFRNSYHGRTRGTVSMCNMKDYHGNRLPGYFRVDYPTSDVDAERVLKELKSIIMMEHKRTTAGIFVEPIQGKTVVIPPKGFLKRLKDEICEPLGVLLIADEYLTSMRTGTYSVCMEEGVYPDIISIGKCLGNGIPLAVLMCLEKNKDAVAEVKGSTTFGGNPLSCAVAIANLNRIEEEKLLDRTRNTIERIFREETKCLESCGLVKECRASGALLGIELINKKTCIMMSKRILEAGVLVSCIGTVIRITPSFVINEQMFRDAIKTICTVLMGEMKNE